MIKINTKSFKETRAWIVQRLKDLGGEDVFVYPKKIQTRAWRIPAFKRPPMMEKMPNLQSEQKQDKQTLGEKEDDDIPF